MTDQTCDNDIASTKVNHKVVLGPLSGDNSLPPQSQLERNMDDASPWRFTTFSEWQHPAAVLTLVSMPFCAGAYIGYKIPISKFEELVGPEPPLSQSIPQGPSVTAGRTVESGIADVDTRKLATRVALKALRVATLGTVGTFGLVGAIWFAANGYRSFDEAMCDTKSKASAWRESIEDFFGADIAMSKTHPEVLATRNMTEDEELQYLYRKYFKGSDTNIQTDSDSKMTKPGIGREVDGVNKPGS
jgi:hypothetical protein